LSDEYKELFKAYSAGVNDFVDGIGITGTTAKLFPPEFYLLGIHKNIKPWLPTDSLGTVLIIHLGLTWDWVSDLTREFNKLNSPELE